jgi:hypothetical protein
MALTELRRAGADPIAEIDAVQVRLESFRAAIDEARRNGWREPGRVGANLEEYLDAVRVAQRSIRSAGASRVDQAPLAWELVPRTSRVG